MYEFSDAAKKGQGQYAIDFCKTLGEVQRLVYAGH
jgi:hypothetical protein